jgi:hypothetical protein
MKITNKFDLPDTLVEACKTDSYSRGESDYSVTEIMSPPRIQRLRHKHFHEMEQDVVDKLWSVMGTAIHTAMERTNVTGHVKEERIFTEIDGIVLSGAIDLQSKSGNLIDITDYKFTSAWALQAEKIEWVQQLNIYAWLVHKTTGVGIGKLSICAIVRDWSRREAMIKPAYPQGQAQMVSIPLWPFETTEAYVRERIELHRQAKVAADFGEELPECTEDDRWVRETKYAVMKEGGKRALRVFDTHAEASELWEITPKSVIQVRKGESVRCTGNYCGVNQWCSQFKRQQELENLAVNEAVQPEA